MPFGFGNDDDQNPLSQFFKRMPGPHRPHYQVDA